MDKEIERNRIKVNLMSFQDGVDLMVDVGVSRNAAIRNVGRLFGFDFSEADIGSRPKKRRRK
jgi:hypothetical protein